MKEEKEKTYRVIGTKLIGKFMGMMGSLITLQMSHGPIRHFSPHKLEEIETVDCTPSWESIVVVMLEALVSSTASDLVKRGIREEIKRMATLADKYVELTVKEEEFLLHLVDVVSCDVAESNNYLATPHRKKLIQQARDTFGKTTEQDRN